MYAVRGEPAASECGLPCRTEQVGKEDANDVHVKQWLATSVDKGGVDGAAGAVVKGQPCNTEDDAFDREPKRWSWPGRDTRTADAGAESILARLPRLRSCTCQSHLDRVSPRLQPTRLVLSEAWTKALADVGRLDLL